MAIAIATHWTELSRTNILTALIYTLNYFHGLGHLWSLGVEEQFYLPWPLGLLLFFRKRLWIVLAAIAAGPVLRMLLWLLWRRAGLEHPFPAFMGALATGAAISLLAPRLKPFQAIFLSPKFLAVPLGTLLIPLPQLWSNRFLRERVLHHFPGRRRALDHSCEGETLLDSELGPIRLGGKHQLQPVSVVATVPESLVVGAVGGLPTEPGSGCTIRGSVLLSGRGAVPETAPTANAQGAAFY